MKKQITLALMATALLVWSPNAFAQDDDGMFGDDSTGDDDTGLDTSTDDTSTDDGGSTEPAEPVAEVGGGMSMSSGTLGVGFSATTTGVAGIEAEYWISPKLMATGLGRLRVISEDSDMVDTLLNLQVGFGAMFVMKAREKAALMLGGRFLLGYASQGDSTTSIGIEVPMRLHMQIHPQVSAHVEGGLALQFGDQSALGGAADTSFAFGIGTNNLYGNTGITFYFE